MNSQALRKLAWSIAAMHLLAGYAVASEETSKCGMYLAPSTIPGAGLGMFAGDRPYAKNKAVGVGDIVIPIFDFRWHNGGKNNAAYPFLWEEYVWLGSGFDHMKVEVNEIDLIKVASPGFGAAANSQLENVKYTKNIKVGRGMNGTSPGVGAISPHYDRHWYAKNGIPPGGELFVR
jgi:hypothetical protein